ncbi:hypothetical protein [Priestia megaterium]|uniref:hypothetical protein n=1 Tax=Priestia megaterium TaxID=1404 RepID=UPI001BE7C58A|nr:hypothetical protein [Priestia megaterium]MBT2259208.1 hypothetical protein [Priestia megaterium]MBT2279791.1 hypothetical protein [Priestia megaterium]
MIILVKLKLYIIGLLLLISFICTGILVKNGDYSIIGKLINETDNDVTIEVSSGKKTYKKSRDFEQDNDNMSGDSKNKVVRLEVKKNDEVESLEVDPEDQ